MKEGIQKHAFENAGPGRPRMPDNLLESRPGRAGGPGCPQKIGPRLVTRSSGLFRLDVIMAPWAMRFCAAARAPTAVLRIGLPPEPSLAPVQRV